MDSNQPSLPSTLKTLEDDLQDLEQHLDILLQHPKADLERVSPMEKAKLNAALAYTVSTLFFIHLKAGGKDPQKHAIVTDLKRVKNGMDKIKAEEAGEAGEATKEPRTTLDISATKRLVSVALEQQNELGDGDNEPEEPVAGSPAPTTSRRARKSNKRKRNKKSKN